MQGYRDKKHRKAGASAEQPNSAKHRSVAALGSKESNPE
jgi:hypothetical protein